jgi:hypothetical protein
MKEKIFNIVVYGMLTYTVAVAGYGALPAEYQNMIPFNWVTALVSGGTTGLLGTAGLVMKSYLDKAKVEANNKFNLLAKSYEQVVNAYQTVNSELKDIKNQFSMTREELNITRKLIETDLRAKLSNVLIDEEVRKLIEGVLDEV